MRLFQPYIVANLPCQQRVLLRRIVPNDQNRRRIVNISHAGSQSRLSMKRRSQSREVGRTMMINIVGVQHHARELLQQIIFFVGGAR